MSTLDRRHMLRAALGLAAAVAIGLPLASSAHAASLSTLKPMPPTDLEPLAEDAASIVVRSGRGRRGRGRPSIIVRPRRRRRCFRNRRGRLVCIMR